MFLARSVIITSPSSPIAHHFLKRLSREPGRGLELRRLDRPALRLDDLDRSAPRSGANDTLRTRPGTSESASSPQPSSAAPAGYSSVPASASSLPPPDSTPSASFGHTPGPWR